MSHLIKVLIGPYTFPSPLDVSPYATNSLVAVSDTLFASIPAGDFTGTPKLQDLSVLSTGGGGGGGGGGGTTPDADSTTKGKLKLTNDLGGTADLPTVPGLSGKE